MSYDDWKAGVWIDWDAKYGVSDEESDEPESEPALDDLDDDDVARLFGPEMAADMNRYGAD